MQNKKPSGKISTPFSYGTGEQGAALALALLFIMLLAVFIPMTLTRTTTDTSRTIDYERSRKAFYVAEAGLQRAVDDLLSGFGDDTYSSIDDVLNAKDGNDVIENLTDIGFGEGTYTITVVDNSDGDGDQTIDVDRVIFMNSTAIVDDETITLQARITQVTPEGPGEPFTSTHAIATESDLLIAGSPVIAGDGGSIHTNGDLTIDGASTTIIQTATAAGDYDVHANADIGDTLNSGGGAGESALPDVDVSDYRDYADIILGADGIVLDSDGAVVFDASGGSKYNATGCSGNKGWAYSAGPPVEWSIGDACGGEGSFYVEGNISFGGSPGSAADPLELTLMAEGSIQISGSPEFINYKNPGDPAGIQDMFMLAGTDIDWAGSPSNAIEGFIYAGEQIELRGNPTINGFIVAKDKANDSDLVTANSVKGNPTITYSLGSVSNPFTVPTWLDTILTILSWNEI